MMRLEGAKPMSSENAKKEKRSGGPVVSFGNISRQITCDNGVAARAGKMLLPASPQLLCPECVFQDGDSDYLARHLIEVHGYEIPKAWFAAGQENERLYPRFKAPPGKFSVLGVDKTTPTGDIIATYTSLEEAIAAADHAAGSFSEISVNDDSCRELYVVIPRPD